MLNYKNTYDPLNSVTKERKLISNIHKISINIKYKN